MELERISKRLGICNQMKPTREPVTILSSAGSQMLRADILVQAKITAKDGHGGYQVSGSKFGEG